eukprot:4840356-Pyramimonas_sp.AAC.1
MSLVPHGNVPVLIAAEASVCRFGLGVRRCLDFCAAAGVNVCICGLGGSECLRSWAAAGADVLNFGRGRAACLEIPPRRKPMS